MTSNVTSVGRSSNADFKFFVLKMISYNSLSLYLMTELTIE